MEAIIIGQCLVVERNTPDMVRFIVHYKGPYKGNWIKSVYLSSNTHGLERGEEYVIHVEVVRIEGMILYGNILRYKNIKYIRIDIF